MSDFEAVAKVGEIPAGEGRAFKVGGRLIAVFFVDGNYTAVDDICPHMGASLSTGYVENGGVICPWHAWRFCVREGTWLDAPKSPIRLGTYEIKIEGDDILLRIPPPASSSPVQPTPT